MSENTNTTEIVKTTKNIGDDFNLDKHLIALLMKNSFYAGISRRIHKIRTTNMPTAGVTWNRELDSICLYYNPNFLASLTNKQVQNILIHEMFHLIFGHLTNRRKKPHRIWNFACDAAINSIIFTNDKCDVNEQDNDKLPLPGFCIVPGRKYPKDITESDKKEHKDVKTLGDVLENMKPMLASEDYFNQLMKEAPPQSGCGGKCKSCGGTGKKPKGNSSGEPGDGQENGESGSESCPDCGGTGYDCEPRELDDHEGWDDLTEEEREYVQNRVRNIVERAVKDADSSNSWGNIPADLQSEIRRSVSNVVPWRSVIRQFIGTLLPGGRTSSIKKINKRYAYIHPGTKKTRNPLILVAIDQSGSVDDDMLATFFGELTSFAKNIDFDVCAFDCEANAKDIYRWRRGAVPPKTRQKHGGTSFQAPTDVVNSPALRGKYDGLLIVTDGECCAPTSSRVKRGWVLAAGHHLNFESNELQVFVDKSKPMKGVWR
jgi:predicted metal-dependent peptidase